MVWQATAALIYSSQIATKPGDINLLFFVAEKEVDYVRRINHLQERHRNYSANYRRRLNFHETLRKSLIAPELASTQVSLSQGDKLRLVLGFCGFASLSSLPFCQHLLVVLVMAF